MPNIFTLTAPSIGYKKSISITILEDTTTIAYVLPDESFKGEYGIDWCDMKDEKTIEKFQGVELSHISHIFDDASNTFISDGITEEKKQSLVKAIYDTKKISKEGFVTEEPKEEDKDKAKVIDYIPTWINLPEGETIKVKVELFVKGEERPNGYVTFQKNDKFEITNGKEQDDEIRLKKLENGKKHKKIYIKALTTFNSTEYITLVDDKGVEVGKIEMEANNVVELKVRIIPVVIASTEKDEKKKKEAELKNAISLREKALKYTEEDQKLNNGFKQAGIKCNIEAAKEPELEYILIDPSNEEDELYNYCGEIDIEDKNAPKPTGHVSGTVPVVYKKVGTLSKYIIEDLTDVYKKRFDPSSSYKGAILFVTDQYSSSTTTGGVSSSTPIGFQGTLIYTSTSSVGIEDETTYVHELGHMLGLGHTFVEDKDTSQDDKDKETVIGKLKDVEEDILKEKNTIDTHTQKIEESKKYLAEHPLSNPMTNSAMYKSSEEDIINSETQIEKSRKILDSLEYDRKIIVGSHFKVTKKKTKNYMDYISDKTYFHRFQAKLIKKEVTTYYV